MRYRFASFGRSQPALQPVEGESSHQSTEDDGPGVGSTQVPSETAAPTAEADPPTEREQAPSSTERQCRICFDGPDPELGRLIRPCMCKGSISYVHVKCLQRWRATATSGTAFFQCPQCKYRYRYARTVSSGLAENPVIIAACSTILFTALVFASSYITTALFSTIDDDSYRHSSSYYFMPYFYSPFTVAQDLVRTALRILRDEQGLIDETVLPPSSRPIRYNEPFRDPAQPSSFLTRFLTRFILGLPLVGAASVIHLILSLPVLGPIHWLTRYRGNRRRSDSRDIAALIVIGLLAVGAARALYQVYRLTERWTKRLLLRAEDIILEVS